MKLKIGKYASYLYTGEELKKPLTTKQFHPFIVDFNSNGTVYGIEIPEEVKVEYYEDYDSEEF